MDTFKQGHPILNQETGYVISARGVPDKLIKDAKEGRERIEHDTTSLSLSISSHITAMGLFSKRPGSSLGPNTGLVSSTPSNARNSGMLSRGRRGASSGEGLGGMTVWMWVVWVVAFVGWWVAFIGMAVGETKLSEWRNVREVR